ncbi:MAG: C25 family cysteine peptidase [Gemmataceae bacterium]|nr:C25 family cysteine peptidase [Gemmataceae bacterium]MDW8265049.1 C25 family cysteine peptidase [Gemmataceae bacterium]
MLHVLHRCCLLLLAWAAACVAGLLAQPGRSVPAAAPEERSVFLAHDLSEEQLIVLSALAFAADPTAVLLLDRPAVAEANRAFLTAFQPRRLVRVSRCSAPDPRLAQRLGVAPTQSIAWETATSQALARTLLRQADHVVVSPVTPSRLLLQAACLAGALRAPLLTLDGPAATETACTESVACWRPRAVWVVGPIDVPSLPGVVVHRLADDEAVAQAHRRQLAGQGPISTLVVANPADSRHGHAAMASLAPWIALQRRAALVLTDDDGSDCAARVQRAVGQPSLSKVDSLFLVADLQAIPMEQRPNPVPGKDAFIDMEPLTPPSVEPVTFATGRLFNQEPGLALLVFARQRLLPPGGSRRTALVASNPGGGLPLLELFSRATTCELRNCGYETSAFFGHDVTPGELRRQLPKFDIFLWEGHHNTLIRDYEFPSWDEPMRPAFVFLQSCLALTEAKVQALWQRGCLGVVGSSTRIYSATGGAFSLAYFDAILYDGQSLGGALRQAKNFLMVYALLKEKRLRGDARLLGANLRSAWAFTLWGDPTLRLPAPARPATALLPANHRLEGETLVVTKPEVTYQILSTDRYTAAIPPNGRLAGLVVRDPDDQGGQLAPLLFAEVVWPQAPPGRIPRLRSSLPSSRWVFSWDNRRRVGYLLALPRAGDPRELRFRVAWVVNAADG